MELQHGFLLNRNSYDLQHNPIIELWVATEQGPAKLLISNEKPLLFIHQQDESQVIQIFNELTISFSTKLLTHQTFEHKTAEAIYFETIHDFYRAREQLSARQINHYESDIRLHERYLMERFAYGSIEFYGQPFVHNGYTEFKHVKLRHSQAHAPTLKTLSFDLECSRHGHLYSIGLSGCGVQKVLMIGTAQPADTDIEWVAHEKMLLQQFMMWINKLDPDLLIGWNVIQFDCQLLIKRAAACQLPLRIGRGKTLARWKDSNGNRQGFITIPGRVVIDGIDALKTATYQFDSFSLEQVAQQLLGRGKLTEAPEQRLAEIEHNFHHNKPQLAAYNLEDCQLVEDIFAKTQIIDFLCLRSQLTGLDLDRNGGSVAAFTNVYLPKIHRAGYIAPNLPVGGGLASPGGYVMDSKPGLYHNVLVLDFKSLYPSIIRTFKIDPMGLIEGIAHPDHAIDGFLGAKFSRDKNFLPEIIRQLWQQRDIAKQAKDSARSHAIKILMNSFYGVLGSGGCRFYDQRLASSITMRGHEIMQQTAKWIQDSGYEVIYGDTDSTFVLLGPGYTTEQASALGKDLEQQINQNWQRTIQESFNLECALELEFETHYQRFHMPTIRGSEAGSKKRYAGLLSNHKIVFKGLETVRSDWTELAKQFQSELYQLVFDDQDPSSMIQDIVEQTRQGKRDHQLIYRKRLRRKLAEYQKNIPPHVRAAREADEQNKKNDKALRYQNKGWVSYLITRNGPQTLEYQNALPDYQHYIDKQLKPVADSLLPFINLDFDHIISAQIGLF
ncbi:MAG: DNA polymerase II [Candidatus Celerinatantimonas neptuna]|nr:MAG: DNA polymerase II [Candidatus Celerinatantimonas neptuna]